VEEVLKRRAITGVIFGVVIIGLLLIGKVGLFILLGLIGSIGIVEYHTIANKPKQEMIIGLIVFALMYTLSIIVDLTKIAKLVLLGISLAFSIIFIINVLSKYRIQHEKRLPYISLIYPGLFVCLPIIFSNEELLKSKFWFYVIILIWISDVGAYLVGRKIGKTKLIPSVSPGKSVEGALGAGISTIVAGMVIWHFSQSNNITFWIAIAISIWIFGIFGDLYESTIKRAFNVKDSGKILPGHGGILDRFDSYIFVIPFLTLILILFKLL
jgi:phosphatidate cytidylyltransferase